MTRSADAAASGSPLVSVLLPVFNGTRHLPETLASIAAQTLADIEVIVVDDGSTDGSLALVEDWAARMPFPVTVIGEPVNLGVHAALLAASTRARGSFVAQIGHDDVWSPDHLAALVARLEETPEAVAAFADVAYIDGEGRPIARDIFHHERIDQLSRAALFADLVAGNYLCAPASLYRRAAWKPCFWGVADERLQDYELWLHLLAVGPFVRVPAIGCRYRIHDGNLSSAATMARQSRSELMGAHLRVFTAPRFADFVAGLADDAERRAFHAALFDSCRRVRDYCPDLIHVQIDLFERLHLLDPDNTASIAAYRSDLYGRFGMLRKSARTARLFPRHMAVDCDWLPWLVPADDAARAPLFADLVEGFVFRDGRDVPLEGTGRYFFYLARADLLAALRRYPSFRRALAQRRVVAYEAETTGPTGFGFALAAGTRLDAALADRLFRFMEDEHGSCMAAPAAPAGPVARLATRLRQGADRLWRASAHLRFHLTRLR